MLWRALLSSSIALACLLAAAGCGGETASGGSGGAAAGGAGVDGGTSGAGGADAGSTPCSAPDWEGCGVPECPGGRPGCQWCGGSEQLGLVFPCAESLDPNERMFAPADGMLLLDTGASFTDLPPVWEQIPFSAALIVASFGQEERLGYADRGKWTGEPIPEPSDCPSFADVPTCGGYCGGCPVGEICTGRSPLHPYGLCIPTTAGICSLVPEVNGDPCEPDEGCFVFTVEPDHQEVADARGFCLPLAQCQAAAALLPGGGRCE